MAMFVSGAEISGAEIHGLKVCDNTQLCDCVIENVGAPGTIVRNFNFARSTIDDANLTDVRITNSNVKGMTVNGVPVEAAIEMWLAANPE